MFDKLKIWLMARFLEFMASDEEAVAAGRLHEPTYKLLYLFSLAVWVISFLVLLGHRIVFGDTWLVYELVWLTVTALSVGQIGKGERAYVWFFNIAAFKWPSSIGLYLTPVGISSVTTIPNTVFERELPDDPEWIQEGDDKEPLRERIDPETGLMRRLVRPIRITTGGEMRPEVYKDLRPAGLPGETEDQKKERMRTTSGPAENLNYTMTVGQNIVLRYRIGNGFDFLIRSEGKTFAQKRAYIEREMADFVVGVLRREYVKYSVGGVALVQADIHEEVRKMLQDQMKTWGIELEQVVIKSPDLSHAVNAALAAKPIASAKAQAAAMEGTGEGQRQGNVIRGVAKAEKDGADILGMTPKDMRLIDKGAEMLKDNKAFVLGTAGITEALGVGEVLRKLVPGTTTPTTIPETTPAPPPVAPPATNTTTDGGST